MVDWGSGIFIFFVVVGVPLILAWCERLASKSVGEKTTFRPAPPLRAVYPGMLIASILAEFFYAKDLWEAKRYPTLMDWVAMIGMLAIFCICVFSWPPTLRATPEGLLWYRLFYRRFIPWNQIENAYSGMDQDMVIFTKSGHRYEINQYTEGRTELKALISQMSSAHVR